uniref:5'-nucleotidase C-terminal domain-containing protein n=1 Tax=Streptococcus ferus TaxID=1345 RepID=UPI0035A0289C
SQSYQPLDLSRTYYLATNDFLAAGGDGYTMLGGSREEGPSLDTVFAAYLAQANLLQYAVINPNSRLVSISSSLDSDGDGFADYQEIQAGTDPSDGASHPDQRLDDDRAGNVSLPRAASSAYAQSTSVYPLSKPVSIPVRYQMSNSQQLRQLPLTNSKESMLALLLGVSLIGFGLYGARRQSYGK